jgi:hypothetical protein
MTRSKPGRCSRAGWCWLVLLGSLLFGGCGAGAAAGSEPGAPDSDEPAEEGAAGSVSGGDEVEGAGAADAYGANVPTPEQGAKSDEKRAMSLGVDITLQRDGRDAGLVGKSWSFEEGRGVIIEKTRGKRITRLSVIYGKREGKGLEDWTPLPTEGKGYTVEAGGAGKPVVLDADGQPAPAQEQQVAITEYGYVGRAHPLLVQVVGAQPSVGAELSLDSAGALALIGYMPEMQGGKLSASYQGTEQHQGREAAKLDVTFESKLKEAALLYALSLSGPAYVDTKTGFVIELDLKGKVRVSGKYTHQGKQFDAKGGGEVTFTRNATLR